MNRVITV